MTPAGAHGSQGKGHRGARGPAAGRGIVVEGDAQLEDENDDHIRFGCDTKCRVVRFRILNGIRKINSMKRKKSLR